MNTLKRNLLLAAILFSFAVDNPAFSQQLPQHMDIIILVDVSGSMQFSLDGSNTNAPVGMRRIDYAKNGLNALHHIFSRLFESATTPAPTDPGDETGGGVQTIRVAIGTFPGLVPLGGGTTPDEFTWLPQSGVSTLRIYNPAIQTELNTIFNGLSITWLGTPIGTALHNPNWMTNGKPYRGAMQMFQDFPNPGGGTNGKMIWLFTDGKRHGGEPIYSGSGSPSAANVLFNSSIDHQSATDVPNNRIKIASLGFGDFSEVDTETDFAMLRDISKYFEPYNITVNPSSGDFTKKAINTALSSGWNRQLGLIDPGHRIVPDSIQVHSDFVTRYDDKKLLFLISWNEPRTENALKFTMRNPAGALIDPDYAARQPNIDYDFGATFKMYTVQEESLSVGEWKLIVNAEDIEKPQWYSYSILGFSDLQLEDRTDPRGQPRFAGDSLKLKVALTADTIFVSNAKITAKVTGPQTGGGNWFANYPLTAAQFDSVLKIEFPGPVENFYKKYYYLHHLKEVPLPGTISFEIPLVYNPKDSLYHGKSSALTRPGIYQVELLATNDTSASGFFFKRNLKLNYYVELKPNLDWSYSSLEFRKIASKERIGIDFYQAKFTPRDQYLNFLKPGKEENIKFTAQNAKLSESPTVDSLAGSYYKFIEVPQSTIRPSLQVQYNDFVFEQRVITDNPTADNWRINPSVISLRLGTALPRGAFAASHVQHFHAAINVARQFHRNYALLALLGHSSFAGKGANSDTTFWNLSGNARWLPIVAPSYRVYINGGGGLYLLGNGSSRAGYNLGAGLNIPLSSNFDVEFGVDYNNIIMPANDFQFVQIYGGILIRF